jgi:hypothetical protein
MSQDPMASLQGQQAPPEHEAGESTEGAPPAWLQVLADARPDGHARELSALQELRERIQTSRQKRLPRG